MSSEGIRTRRWLGAVVVIALLSTGCARRRIVTFEMVWSVLSEPDHVVLDFAEFPNHYVSIESVELRSYLESLGSDRVEVKFEVTTRLGCVERLRSLRIGERSDWQKEWGGSGWVNQEYPSPWDRYRCRIPWLKR